MSTIEELTRPVNTAIPHDYSKRAMVFGGRSSMELAAKIAGKLDMLPAGEGVVGAVIGAALIIFLVLLVTDLLGMTSVFGLTNKGSARP